MLRLVLYCFLPVDIAWVPICHNYQPLAAADLVLVPGLWASWYILRMLRILSEFALGEYSCCRWSLGRSL